MFKIVVVGGSGFVGQSLIKRLKSKKVELYVPSKEKMNITFPQKIKQFFMEVGEVDCIIHLAAKTPQENVHPLDYYLINTIGTYNICKYALYRNIIYTSSYDVYGTKKEKYVETDDCFPETHYSMSKYAGEKWVMQLAPSYIILRFSCLYGENEPYRNRFIPISMERAISGSPVEIWGKGSGGRDYLYIDDAVDAILACIERIVKNNCIFKDVINIGYGKAITKKEIGEKIAELAGVSVVYKKNDWKDYTKYLDIEKAKKVLKWKPKTLWKVGIEKTFHWWVSKMK